MTLNSGSEVPQGHWKWYQSLDWVWFPISVLYKLCPKTIFDFKNALTLKSGSKVTQGYCKCHRSIERLWLPIGVYIWLYLLLFMSYLTSTKCRDLEIRVRGHSKSLKVVAFDRLDTASYFCSIVTLSLKCTGLRYFTSKTVVTLKSVSKVTQGHWKWYH